MWKPWKVCELHSSLLFDAQDRQDVLQLTWVLLYVFVVACLMMPLIWLISEASLVAPSKFARQMQSPSSLPLTEAIKHCATRILWSSFCQRHRGICWCHVSRQWAGKREIPMTFLRANLEMQVTYDLEDQKSLAKYLEDSNIRLIRAECPALHSQLFVFYNYVELADWHLHMLSIRSDQCFNLHSHRNYLEFRIIIFL